MITEDYCSFEISKLLKEKGFNEPCTELNKLCLRDGEKPVLKVTHQKAMKWLREVHNIIIEPESVWNGKKWEYLLFIVTPQNANSPYYEHDPYKSYEECIEAALKYSLENLI